MQTRTKSNICLFAQKILKGGIYNTMYMICNIFTTAYLLHMFVNNIIQTKDFTGISSNLRLKL